MFLTICQAYHKEKKVSYKSPRKKSEHILIAFSLQSPNSHKIPIGFSAKKTFLNTSDLISNLLYNKSTASCYLHFAYINHVSHSIKQLYTYQLFNNIINIVAN